MRPIVLITGASAGIGVELARVFAAHDHDLVLVARREDRLRALADEIRFSPLSVKAAGHAAARRGTRLSIFARARARPLAAASGLIFSPSRCTNVTSLRPRNPSTVRR